MNRLPKLFQLQSALEVLSRQTDVLPAVGGATEDELRPDHDEIEDDRVSSGDILLDEPFEFGCTGGNVALSPLKRTDDHVFRYFQDGSLRSFFAGTALEHDRQTPVIVGQVGSVALRREDDGRLCVAELFQRHLLLVAFSQISESVRTQIEAAVTAMGPGYQFADIEDAGNERQDLRMRAQARLQNEMVRVESETLRAVVKRGKGWLVVDGSIRFTATEELRKIFGEEQPPVVGVSKSFSKKPTFKLGLKGSKTVNLWQLLADLPEGNRTMAWKAQYGGHTVAVWYQRLRMHRFMDYPLMGVIKVELPILGTEAPTSNLINKLACALLAERTVTPHGLDRRWHAHLYPVFQAERCVKNGFVSTSILRAGLHWPNHTKR
jgi:hypothetical protein